MHRSGFAASQPWGV